MPLSADPRPTAPPRRPPPTLRVRSAGNRVLADWLSGQGEYDVTSFVLRERLRVGRRFALEVSFGPLADEVILQVEVTALAAAASSGASRFGVMAMLGQLAQLRYLRAIMRSDREPAARAHRRWRSNLSVEWESQHGRFTGKLCDVSRGGAFIESQFAPPSNASLRVSLPDGTGRRGLVLPSVVSRIEDERQPEVERSGFSVRFRPEDSVRANQLEKFLRRLQRD